MGKGQCALQFKRYLTSCLFPIPTSIVLSPCSAMLQEAHTEIGNEECEDKKLHTYTYKYSTSSFSLLDHENV